MTGPEAAAVRAIRAVRAVAESADLALWFCVRSALDRGMDEALVLKALGIGRATMYRRLGKYGLTGETAGSPEKMT